MALPKLNTPTYELEMPSTDEKIQFRPFLVKEEKILLMAMETEKNQDIIRAVKDIVSECTFNKVDFSNVPMFDTEYVFLQIRSKSVGEVSKLRLLCPDDKKTRVDVEVNLEEVDVQMEKDHTSTIELSNDVSMVMRYPCLKDMIGFDDGGQITNIFSMIKRCIHEVRQGEKVFNKVDMSEK